jgi:hypothetical protein
MEAEPGRFLGTPGKRCAGNTVGIVRSGFRVVAKRLLVWSLEVLCGVFDLAPAFLRRHFRCRLFQWSIALDERLGTNVWKVN